MRAIFISYRRDDAEGEAGRLFDDLIGHFGADTVFMDVAGIEPGRDFRKVIDQNVASCGVLLAMIGRGWCDAKDDAGQRRLDNPMDFVRLETASALRRDIPVIPVLVHGGRMPRVEQLPDDLKDLAYRNCVEVTHARWDSDVQVLIRALQPYVGNTQSGAATRRGGRTPQPPAPILSRRTWVLIGAASLALLLIAAIALVMVSRSRAERLEAARRAAELASQGGPDTAGQTGLGTRVLFVTSSDSSAEGAQVLVDGAYRGVTAREAPGRQAFSLMLTNIPLGVHLVTVRQDGYADFLQRVKVAPSDRPPEQTPKVVVGFSLALNVGGDTPPVQSPVDPATCKVGYVWREAFAGDKVCVDPKVRTEAAADNAASPGRTKSDGYCVIGYVWREASPADRICVVPDRRTQAAEDNANAAGRIQ